MTNAPDPADVKAARKKRNLAIGIGLFVFALLIFLITVVRLGGDVLDRPL